VLAWHDPTAQPLLSKQADDDAVHPEVVAYLRCPVCRAALATRAGSLRCGAGHSFDIARQGYGDLTAGRLTHAGDTTEMVYARESVLADGHFDFVTAAVVRALPAYTEGLAVEVGAGTAFHLAALLDAAPGLWGLALDVSKPALRRAARRHPRLAAIRADAWRPLPIADRAATAVLNVFAPRAGGELHRILRPEGALVTVTPEPAHLAELVGPLGLLTVDPDKEGRLAAALEPHFTLVERTVHARRLVLTREQARVLVAMGPSAWHVDPAALDTGLTRLPTPLEVQACVLVSVWQPRERPTLRNDSGAGVRGGSGPNPVAA
jgi:23S rRNA (guanine745-N1)-methyltransferase